MLKGIRRATKEYTKKRKAADIPDPRAIALRRTINGITLTSYELALSPAELEDRVKRLRHEGWQPTAIAPEQADTYHESSSGPEFDILTWATPAPVRCYIDELGAVVEDEPGPDSTAPGKDRVDVNHDHNIPGADKLHMHELRALALETITVLEAPPADLQCATPECDAAGAYRCQDCDSVALYCRMCLLNGHPNLPFHRLRFWDGKYFRQESLARLGYVIGMGHGARRCPRESDASGPQEVTILDTNGVHRVHVGWCRCANAPLHAEQLLRLRMFPGTFQRPTTAFTFRAMKLFQMLNHVGRLTPWDWCGAQLRLTDNVEPGSLQDVYKQFNRAQRQWRIVRAWARGGVVDPGAPKTLGIPCVTCPIPGVNLPAGWQDDPDADLIYAAYVGGDGNMRLSRNNKGGGEVGDPSLFGDDAFYAPNESYKDFCRVRGGAPDDQSDITCRGLRAGNPARVTNSHNKPCTGIVSISCIRSGAFFTRGTVDLAKGERFVNFDFALVQVILGLLSLGVVRLVISYDIACKYYIHFLERIAHETWPLMTEEQRAKLLTIVIVWLVPKFHLAAHIEGCADKFSFNWTKNVGRTCGEMVESNWASLGLLANSTREMGFGHRRDTLNDCMLDWNWRKAIGEADRITSAYTVATSMLERKEKTLANLEEAMGPERVAKLIAASDAADGSQFRPRMIESPSRHAVLKLIQEEEAATVQGDLGTARPRSARVSRSVGINMGLDLELRQQNLRVKIKSQKNLTDAKTLDLNEARRKMSKALDAWYATLADFMPADALQEPLGGEARPETEVLRLPSDFPRASFERLGLLELAGMERQLRVGQAHDALKKLRSALGLKSFLVKQKYKHAGGQGVLTRSQVHIAKIDRQVTKWKEVYQRAWRALEHLRGDVDIPSSETSWLKLRPLNDADCIMLSAWTVQHQYWQSEGEMKEADAAHRGEGRQELPWIWKMEFDFGDKPQDDSDEEIEGSPADNVGNEVGRSTSDDVQKMVQKKIDKWTSEVIRLEWLHARASRDRFSEEVRLLRAESSRAGLTFRHYEKTWLDRAREWEDRVGTDIRGDFWRGAVAGAHRRANVFARLAVHAEKRYSEILAN